MSTTIKKNNDYHILFKIKDKDGNVLPLSDFSEYEIELLDKEGSTVRSLKTSNTVEEGKLYEYDTETLEFYIETRDTEGVDYLKAVIKTKKSDSNISDGVFDNSQTIDEYFIR